MKRLFCLTILLASALACAASSSDFTGTWSGAIKLPTTPLNVTVHLSQQNGWQGTIDIPAQQVTGAPLEDISVDGAHITFVIKNVAGNPTFDGKLNKDEIKGDFSQSGQSFPFTLSRQSAKAPVPTASLSDQDKQAAQKRCEQYTQWFYQGDFDKLWQRFSSQMKSALGNEDGLKATQQQFMSQAGKEQQHLSEEVTSQQGFLTCTYTARYSKAGTPFSLEWSFDKDGTIVGLFFKPAAAQGSLSDILAEFKALPGKVSVLVTKDNQDEAALNTDSPLAVGSSFKLAVLTALKQQIAAGQHSWDEVVHLKESDKSLPSGILQTWPDGTALTVQALATLMISISDNTAADTLINLVGQDALTKLSPRNTPFLTTQQAFKLKNPDNKDLLKRYLNGDAAAKKDVLKSLQSSSLPSATLFAGNPVTPQVEWFFTTRELCGLMSKVQDLPLMSVNPGVANPEKWAHVAFKGGSEPGVENLTTQLTASGGAQYCVSVTQNRSDTPLDQAKLISLYSGLLGALK
jgi:beta-lactamase class A